jgi:hypothetical protein
METEVRINTAPTARIVAPATAYIGDSLMIDVETYNADGDTLTEELVIDGIDYTAPAVITPDTEGILPVQLTVTDGEAEATDRVDIQIIPRPWQPEDNTIYVFEGDKTVYELYCESRDIYVQTMKSVSYAVQIHNRDYEAQWRIVAGACTWEAT